MSEVATRSLLPTTRGNVLLAILLVIVEMTLAAVAGLSMLPFLAVAVLFLTVIMAVVRREDTDPKMAARLANFVTLILVLKVCSLVVWVTGGAASVYVGILYLPMFLGALLYEVRGSLGVGIAVACLFLIAPTDLGTNTVARVTANSAALSLGGVFLFVSFFAGVFSRRLTRAARSATRNARLQQQRAYEFEWFTDTSVMMESLLDLETMLSAGLVRIMELIPSDCAAFFLRDPDTAQMSLVQFTSRRGAVAGRSQLSLDEQEPLRLAGFSVLCWPDAPNMEREMGAFREIVPDAGSVMATTLRTLDDVFGAVYISTKKTNAYTDRHCELLEQFARHVVYPIQRVRLHAQATTDVMTGLYNHRAFQRRLRDEVERSRRYGHPVSLILLDLDHFKRVNDTLGHQAGDTLLAQIGGILRRNSRGIDFAARYGGEEMAVLCPETRAEDAAIVADRIRQTVADRVFELTSGVQTRITVSLGIAAMHEHATDESSLIEAADRALYEAKAKGRNRVQIATTHPSSLKPTAKTPVVR